MKLTGAFILTAVIRTSRSNYYAKRKKRRKQDKKLHETEMKLAQTEQGKLNELVETKNRELVSNAMNMARKNEFINDLNKELESLFQNEKIHFSTKMIKQKLKLESQLDDYRE